MGSNEDSPQRDMDENMSELKSEYKSEFRICGKFRNEIDNNDEAEISFEMKAEEQPHENNILVEATFQPSLLESEQQILEENGTCLDDLQAGVEQEGQQNEQSKAKDCEDSAAIQIESNSNNKQDSLIKKPENRPLVLEERHSLSIAETKKRRASVYSNENLFIPKELARGELYQRRQDQIGGNSDYLIRMLKFPVGCGRARHVAHQLKHKKEKKKMKQKRSERKATTELAKNTENSLTELSIKKEKELPLSMPNLSCEIGDKNTLYSDDECCIVLEEMTQHMEGKADASSDLDRCNDNVLAAGKLFRWHNPDYNDTFIKMELMANLTSSAEIHVGYAEVQAGAAKEEKTPQQSSVAEEATRDVADVVPVDELYMPNDNHVVTEQHPRQEQQPEQQVADVSTIPIRSHPEPQYPEMPQHRELLLQRISLHSENFGSDKGVQALNLNLMNQCSRQCCVKYPCPQDPQQQEPIVWQPHVVHYDTSHLAAGQEELQQLNAQYQHLKYQEDEQLKCINKSLKEVCANRLINERQHAQYHRMFMHNMIESKKQEEHLQMQKEHLKRKLGDELAHLQQCIAEKQRQLQEQTRTWQWQQQQQQQQQYLHLPQQQHFLRQLQAASYQPRLQCFQDAFSTHYSEISYIAEEAHHRLMSQQPLAASLPAATPAPASQPPPQPQPPPQSVYTLPPMAHTSEIGRRNGHIMRRRHTIDQRQNHTHPYVQAAVNPFQAYPSTTPNYVHAPTTMDSLTTTTPPAHHFAIPETPASHDRTQVNQAIEQTAITSIISNYVNNYLNDMESRHPKTS